MSKEDERSKEQSRSTPTSKSQTTSYGKQKTKSLSQLLSEHLEDDKIYKFSGVIDQINFERIPRLASQARMRSWTYRGPKMFRKVAYRAAYKTCEITWPPHCGSFNILFQIQFEDGIRWMLKIPAKGSQWDNPSSRFLRAEALTMEFIRKNTSIPIPRVYCFNATIHNIINCPYILLEHIEGASLSSLWFNSKDSYDELQSFRERALKEISGAMIQLQKFTFSEAGSLIFNKRGRPIGIGPLKSINHFAHLARRFALEESTSDMYYEKGPFNKLLDFYFAGLNQEDLSQKPPRIQGQRKLLRLFIMWFVQATSKADSNFVLAHPDFNFQNILVAKDGSLQAIIDWEGVGSVPRCIGYEEHPLWLTRDWNPYWWNYDAKLGLLIDLDGEPVMLPQELEHCRSMYTEFVSMVKTRQSQTESCSKTTSRLSPLARSLYIAGNEPMATNEIVEMIFDKITDLTNDEDQSHSSVRSDSDTQFGFNDRAKDDSSPSSLYSTDCGMNAVQGDPFDTDVQSMGNQITAFQDTNFQEANSKDANLEIMSIQNENDLGRKVHAMEDEDFGECQHMDTSKTNAESTLQPGHENPLFKCGPVSSEMAEACSPETVSTTGTRFESDFRDDSSYPGASQSSSCSAEDYKLWPIVSVLRQPIASCRHLGRMITTNFRSVLRIKFPAQSLSLEPECVVHHQEEHSADLMSAARNELGHEKLLEASDPLIAHTNPDLGVDEAALLFVLPWVFWFMMLSTGFIAIFSWLQSFLSASVCIAMCLLSISNSPLGSNAAAFISSGILLTKILSSGLKDRPPTVILSKDRNQQSGTETGLTIKSPVDGMITSVGEDHSQSRNDFWESSTTAKATSEWGKDGKTISLQRRESEPTLHRGSLDSVKQQVAEEDPLHDFGHFDSWDICHALYKNSLDDARVYRMKFGFVRLLASLDESFCGYDGLE